MIYETIDSQFVEIESICGTCISFLQIIVRDFYSHDQASLVQKFINMTVCIELEEVPPYAHGTMLWKSGWSYLSLDS